MKSKTNTLRELFPQKQIPLILNAILKAGNRLKKQSTTTGEENEDSLTRRLHAYLIMDDLFRNGPLSIQLQPEIPPSNNNSSYGKIDLLVPSNSGYQVYFAIEAKRLRYKSPKGTLVAGNSQYINEGMMRFVTEQYGPYVQDGAMLGYVFDKNIAQAIRGINSCIIGKAKELKIKPPKKLKGSQIVPQAKIYETNHDLQGELFNIYHIFLSI